MSDGFSEFAAGHGFVSWKGWQAYKARLNWEALFIDHDVSGGVAKLARSKQNRQICIFLSCALQNNVK